VNLNQGLGEVGDSTNKALTSMLKCQNFKEDFILEFID